MAKKVKDELSEVAKSLVEKYGEDIIFSGDYLTENKEEIISTGLLGLDIAFNGGIREGSIVYLGGLAKVGKTSMMLLFLAQAQKAGKTCYFIDAECRLQPELLSCIDGLNINKLRIIRSTLEKQLTAEETFTIIETLIKDDPGCVILLDSLAALATEAEISGEMTDQQRATMPKLTYKLMRKISQLVRPTKSTLITLTHVQANPSGYGSPFKEVGGNAPVFFASYWATCTSSKMVEDNGKKIGRESIFKVSATANGAPGAEPVIFIRFGEGADKYSDIIKIAEDLGVLSKAGSWYSLQLDDLKDESGKYPKMQGAESVRSYLKETPDAFAKLDKHLRNMVFGA